eukprot:TRINITY_DN50604_c0_g1_i1.p1 TRINITY_DN50604_c0_g1~~TRINITY_DN50604_c0_g1_i1.p1  ORF type:complete len:382 (+),score=63.37 TRINITY_DN50604_c0_g1_i1:74-1147(+)
MGRHGGVRLLVAAGAVAGGARSGRRVAKAGHGLTVYIRSATGTAAVELEMDATVGDLRNAADVPRGVVMRFGDTVLGDDSALLSDTGISAEATVDVDTVPLRWDREAKGAEAALTEDDMMVHCVRGPVTQSDSANVVRGTVGYVTGRHYWEVELVCWNGHGSGRDLIGICTADQQLDRMPGKPAGMGSSDHAWGVGMWQARWRKEHGGDSPEVDGAPSPRQGDNVGVLLDCERSFVRFYLNGKPMGSAPAASALSTASAKGIPLYPAVCVGRLTGDHRYRLRTEVQMPADADCDPACAVVAGQPSRGGRGSGSSSVSPSKVSLVVGMGFDTAAATQALQRSGGNVERAIAFLVEGAG